MPQLPRSTLFPYTTLFRSDQQAARERKRRAAGDGERSPRRRSLRRQDGRPFEPARRGGRLGGGRSEEHTSELQSLTNLVCRLLLEKKKNYANHPEYITHPT